jgi:DNA-binding IclR family transcriptional regulator
MPQHATDKTDKVDKADKVQRAVQSVEVGGRLLLALAAHPGPLSLKDLAAAAGLPAARAHPYLVSFGKLALITQDAASGRYALGPAALQLGLACLRQLDPVKEATPIADALAAQTGHAVALSVWGDFGPTIIHMAEARRPLHVSLRVGSVMSLLSTATGRAFAACLPMETLRSALSPLDPPELRAGGKKLDDYEDELRAIAQEFRQHGVARAVGSPIPGVNAFCAIAYNQQAQPVIGLTALDLQDNLPSAWDAPAAQAVREAAAAISHRLGGAAPAV